MLCSGEEQITAQEEHRSHKQRGELGGGQPVLAGFCEQGWAAWKPAG